MSLQNSPTIKLVEFTKLDSVLGLLEMARHQSFERRSRKQVLEVAANELSSLIVHDLPAKARRLDSSEVGSTLLSGKKPSNGVEEHTQIENRIKVSGFTT